MMADYTQYQNPLIERYTSREMSALFSPQNKFSTWRRLWIALAETERELGIDIRAEQIEEMKAHVEDINFDVARGREKEVRHDVMAHVYAYGIQCPKAKPIIHLGATSAYVGDNTDLIQIRDGLQLIRKRLLNVIAALRNFALTYKEVPTLGFTHFQPAQPTTVGKRATLWIQDFLMDLDELDHRIAELRFRGVKGTTGTQASFMELFGGDEEKVRRLDQLVSEKMGFTKRFRVTGQTYTRKVDSQVTAALSGIAQSAHKLSNDLRLLQHLKEIEEPFETHQIGSSAMPYKRNPMRSERIAALSRYVITTALSPAFTQASQWFERTLDDSANKRLSIPETFLAVDAILILCHNVASGLVVYPKMIELHLREELPFMAAERILMAAVQRGGDRQDLHERLRVHAMDASKRVKQEGEANDFVVRIAADEAFGMTREELECLLDPKHFIGRAPGQVVEFLKEEVDPVLEANKTELGEVEEPKV